MFTIPERDIDLGKKQKKNTEIPDLTYFYYNIFAHC